MPPDEPVLRPAVKLIPLTPGPALSHTARRAELRAAVGQVVTHLVVRAIPPDSRSPYFEQARDLLEGAGLGLDELVAVAEGALARHRLFETLGLTEADA